MRKKLHTHYDNLKVARNAPPEVIRAAYKTLSQKYHPDRNPDNAEASRIMALINTSYEVLSDQEKRKSHDLWIAEQEVVVRRPPPPPPEQPRASRAEPRTESAAPKTSASAVFGSRLRQHWATRHLLRYGLLYISSAVFIWTFSSDKQAPAVTMPKQYVATPPMEPEASLTTSKRTPFAPNGAPWPHNAGYVDGYPKLRMQGLSTVTVDNRQNDGDVFVKLVYLGDDQAFPVRQFFIPARGKFTLTKVNPGDYDIRYRNLQNGALARSEAFKLEESSTTEGIQFSKITMTLYKVENGNMQTYNLTDEEF
ncbi:J domain-containing protein [Methylovorus mays]|uniref:J domain-containing protein n=1 Tax=Methylovorus mays TaxID=184077 RepID=UPI001E3DB89C|nr:J domain-containing protein [Methylovorus mays]MCB5207288.1 J domain-containing protein [Methylovorus mays]